MTTSQRIALFAAATAAVSWTAKSIAIGTAGGLDKSPLEGPLFFAGLLSCLTAAVALGVALTRGRSRAVRIAAGIAGPVLGAALAAAVDAVVGLFRAADAERFWVWSEVNLWVLAVLTLALAIRVATGDRIPRTSVRHHQSLAH